MQVVIYDPIGMLGSIRVSGLWHQFFGEPVEDYKVTWRHGQGYKDYDPIILSAPHRKGNSKHSDVFFSLEHLKDYDDLARRFMEIRPLYFDMEFSGVLFRDASGSGIGPLYKVTVSSNGFMIPEAYQNSDFSVPGSREWKVFLEPMGSSDLEPQEVFSKSQTMIFAQVRITNVEWPYYNILQIYKEYIKRSRNEDVTFDMDAVRWLEKNQFGEKNRLDKSQNNATFGTGLSQNPDSDEILAGLNTDVGLSWPEQLNFIRDSLKTVMDKPQNDDAFWSESYQPPKLGGVWTTEDTWFKKVGNCHSCYNQPRCDLGVRDLKEDKLALPQKYCSIRILEQTEGYFRAFIREKASEGRIYEDPDGPGSFSHYIGVYVTVDADGNYVDEPVKAIFTNVFKGLGFGYDDDDYRRTFIRMKKREERYVRDMKSSGGVWINELMDELYEKHKQEEN